MLCWRCESCFAKYSMPKIPFHTTLDQYIRLHGCPRCSHHLEDLGSPQMESQMTFEEVLLRMKMRGEEEKGKEKEVEVEEVASPWYEDYR